MDGNRDADRDGRRNATELLPSFSGSILPLSPARLRNMPTPDGVSSALPSRLPEPIDSPIIQNDGKTMSPLRPEWMHLARHEPIGSSVIHE